MLKYTLPGHYADYFKTNDDGTVQFDDHRIRDVYKSYGDSIVVELLLPNPRYRMHVLLSLLGDCVQEAPKESKRFPRAMWDTVGDLAVSSPKAPPLVLIRLDDRLP